MIKNRNTRPPKHKVKRNNMWKKNFFTPKTIVGIILGGGILVALIYVLILYNVGAISIGGMQKQEKTVVTKSEIPFVDTEEVEKKQKADKEKYKEKNSQSEAPKTEESLLEDDTKEEDVKIEKTSSKGIIVLDPGHGKSSSSMTDSEKTNDGWVYVSGKGWGEWRHWKSGTVWQDCQGSGCSGRAPQNGGCWYPIGAGDRDKEPTINLNNCLAAKKYLEEMGYEVRLTRQDNSTNPSMTQRLKYCYPQNDITAEPDADAFVCIHSNAGGGRGSYYIALSGLYDQAGIDGSYITSGNALGKSINDKIVANTSLSAASGGRYEGYPTLVLFCKSPVTIAYMEIGFFDNSSDLAILNSSADAIGKSIAQGIDEYMTENKA